MIPVKIHCGCGQKYAFDIEPVNCRMPMPVACPACGADGTADANESIARTLTAQPVMAPKTAPPIRVTLPPQTVPAAHPTVPAQAAPPPPPTLPPPASPPPLPNRPNAQPAKRGKDGWATEESQLNKMGTYITVIPPVLAALLSWGIVEVEVPISILCIIVGIGGLVGGALNIAGRGPLAAGAGVGLLIALGGYGAVCWWIHDRRSVAKIEIMIAFVVGAAPGFLLQFVLQQILRKRSASA